MGDLEALRESVRLLSENDQLREQLVEDRDRRILEALAAGATWVTVQQAAGLSPRGLQLAIKRARSAA